MGGFQQTLVSILLLLAGCTMFLASRDTEEESISQTYSNQISPTQSPAVTQVFFPISLNRYSNVLSETVTPGLPETGGRPDYWGHCVDVEPEGQYTRVIMQDGRRICVEGLEESGLKGSIIRFRGFYIDPEGRICAREVEYK